MVKSFRERSVAREIAFNGGRFGLHWVPEYDYLRMNLELNNGKEGLGSSTRNSLKEDNWQNYVLLSVFGCLMAKFQ